MKDINILAIESSCDETSASVIQNGVTELSNVVLTQMDIHKLYGGVVPEIASRNHIKNITMVIDEAMTNSNLKLEELDAIAVTRGPGLIGSLLVGVEAAKTLALTLNKPLIPVHHIAGHIYANNLVKRLEFPLIALIVSGGHTEIILMEEDYSFKKLGGTLDDAVGEAFDKVARVLNLPYPGGPVIDKLAKEGNLTYKLPMPMDDKSYDFSFSGLKSAVINLIHNEKQRDNEIRINDMAASFSNSAVGIIVKKTMRALNEYDIKNLIVAGGVAANSHLRSELKRQCEEKDVNLTVPPISYCTDNAAMIGAAAYYAYLDGERADLKLNAKATISLANKD